MRSLLKAIGVQLVVLAGLAVLASLLPWVVAPPYPVWGWVLGQGLLAALLSRLLGQEAWWQWIQFLFPLGFYVVLWSGVDLGWSLLLFVGLWLVFSNAGKERVPLYLSNRATQQAVSEVLQGCEALRFMDLGSGLGGMVAFMAGQGRVAHSAGVETAPLPYLWSRVLTWFKGGHVMAQSLWHTDLSDYDLVYAFLSTQPMPRLWDKVLREMKPGSVFVSNSFPVPEVEPSEVWELSDARKTRLYLYRM